MWSLWGPSSTEFCYGTPGNWFPMWICGTSSSGSTNGGFALLLGLAVPWHVVGNWQCTPESWEILSKKSWGEWCAYHTQCQDDWLNHKKKWVGAYFQTAVLYNGSMWVKRQEEDKGLWGKSVRQREIQIYSKHVEEGAACTWGGAGKG